MHSSSPNPPVDQLEELLKIVKDQIKLKIIDLEGLKELTAKLDQYAQWLAEESRKRKTIIAEEKTQSLAFVKTKEETSEASPQDILLMTISKQIDILNSMEVKTRGNLSDYEVSFESYRKAIQQLNALGYRDDNMPISEEVIHPDNYRKMLGYIENMDLITKGIDSLKPVLLTAMVKDLESVLNNKTLCDKFSKENIDALITLQQAAQEKLSAPKMSPLMARMGLQGRRLAVQVASEEADVAPVRQFSPSPT